MWIWRCAKCNDAVHVGVSCEKAMRKRGKEGEVRQMEAWAEWRGAEEVGVCPRCGVRIEKNVGCNVRELGSDFHLMLVPPSAHAV